MATCFCCEKNIPVSDAKVCPACGHHLMGAGWSGIDFHWQARHERELPFATFWTGLCEAHRNACREAGGSGADAPVPPASECEAEGAEGGPGRASPRRPRHRRRQRSSLLKSHRVWNLEYRGWNPGALDRRAPAAP